MEWLVRYLLMRIADIKNSSTFDANRITTHKRGYGRRSSSHTQPLARIGLASNWSQIVAGPLQIKAKSRAKRFPLGRIYERRVEPFIEKCLVINFWRIGGESDKSA